MDPLSVYASVVALVGAVQTVIGYLNDVKDGNEQRQRLRDEITSLWSVLHHLQAAISADVTGKKWGQQLQSLDQSGGVLEQCKKLVDALQAQLLPKSKSKSDKVLQSLRWSFTKGEVQLKINQLHRFQTAINGVLAQTTLSVSYEIAADGRASRALLEDEQATQIRNWLSSTDSIAQHTTNSSDYCPGTGTTFLQSDQFLGWLTAPSYLLWCRGPPGAGKTYLSSIVVDHLRATFTVEEAFVLVAYCHYDDPACQKLENIVGDLVRQTITENNIPKSLSTLFGENSSQNSPPSLEALLRSLSEQLSLRRRAFIVLDAADEIPEVADRRRLLDLLRSERIPANMLITSRDLEDIQERLSPTNNVCDGCKKARPEHDLPILYRCYGGCDFDICEDCYNGGLKCHNTHHEGMTERRQHGFRYEVSATPKDIEQYVNWRVSSDTAISSLFVGRSELRDQLVKSALDHAQSIFLIVKLLMDAVATCLNAKQLRRTLEKIPDSLDVAYDATLRRIDRQNAEWSRLAYEVMTWVCFAQRPLSTQEIEHAVAIEHGTHEFDTENIIPAQKLVDLCAGLVVIDVFGNVRFVHPSVKDYLTGRTASRSLHGEVFLTNSCLTYLLYDVFGMGPTPTGKKLRTRIVKFPLLPYCATRVLKHFDTANDSECRRMAEKLVHNKNFWQSAYQASGSVDEDSPLDFIVLEGLSVLHYAADFGGSEILNTFVGTTAFEINAVGNNAGHTALMKATLKKNVRLMSRLLDLKAKVNLQDKYGWTALHFAAWQGDAEVVDTLLKAKRINLDLLNNKGDSALTMAIYRKHGETALRILQAGADTNAKAINGASPLGCAIIDDSTCLLDKLLACHGVDVNLFSGMYSPLMIASWHGSLEAIQRLLQFDHLEINAQSRDEGWTALMFAIDYSHFEAANLLLEHKNISVDVACDYEILDRETQAHSGYGQTALYFAIRKRNLDLVKRILAKGASVNVFGMDGWTALHAAASLNFTEIVACLLRSYVEVVTPSAPIGLLQKGSDKLDNGVSEHTNTRSSGRVVDIRAGKRALTALHCAVHYVNMDIARLLLEHGADIHVKDDQNQFTPVEYALYWNEKGMLDFFFSVEPTHPLLLARGLGDTTSSSQDAGILHFSEVFADSVV